MFTQTLWNKPLEWDDKICNKDLAVWLTIISDLSKLSDCVVKQCITLSERNENVSFYLLCFCDASQGTYAVTLYLYQKRKLRLKCKSKRLPTTSTKKLDNMAMLGARTLKLRRDVDPHQ